MSPELTPRSTMPNLTLRNLERVCGGRLYGISPKERAADVAGGAARAENSAAEDCDGRGLLDTEAACVVIDSRRLQPGGIFIATKGERVDGHDFIPQVFQNGALAVICERLPGTGGADGGAAPADAPIPASNLPGPCLLVEDSFAALRAIAAFYRGQLSCRVVGVTGSVGKTSTKEMIASVLRQRFSVCATEGNFNNEVGVPLTLLRIRSGDDCAVVEMGINHFGEMERLAKMVRPDVAVITNIGDCHLEALGDRDGVLRAKAEIYRGMGSDGIVILNGMDEKLSGIREANGRPPLFYGLEKLAGNPEPVRDTASAPHGSGANGALLAVCASHVQSRGYDGTEALLSIAGADPFEIQVPLPGEHMLLNACAAAAVGALAFGLSAEEIRQGIRALQAVSGRSNVLRGSRFHIVDDCYNANPASVRAALRLLGESGTAGAKIAVLGDMFELGEKERELHRQIGEYAAGLADAGKLRALCCIGELSEAMAEGARTPEGESPSRPEDPPESAELPAPGQAGGKLSVFHYAAVEDFLDRGIPQLPNGATVLVKASHGMHFERIVEALKAQNDAAADPG